MTRFLLLMSSCCCLPLLSLGQQVRDAELETLSATFRKQAQDAEAAQLAMYADEIEKWRQSCLSKNDAAAAEKATVEYESVLQRLKTLTAAPPSALPPGLPAPTSVQGGGRDPNMEELFSSEAAPVEQRPKVDYLKRPLVLRIQNSTRTPETRTNRQLWAAEGATAKWTIEDLPPGKYRLSIKFKAMKGESGGTGKLELTGFAAPISFGIKPTREDWKEVESQDLALITLEKCPVDLTITCTGLSTPAGPLCDLLNVVFTSENQAQNQNQNRPEPKPQPEPNAPPKPPEENRRKVDF